MKIPRDVDGNQLVKALRILGYGVARQKGSHICLTTQQDGENHEVVPAHRPIKTGTLASILKRIALHHNRPSKNCCENSTFKLSQREIPAAPPSPPLA